MDKRRQSILLFKDYKFQLLATLCVNIISISQGVSNSLLSPFLTLLQSDQTPLVSGKVTVEEASWLGSLVAIGAIIGNFCFGYISDRFGRKNGLFCIAVPHTAFWLLLWFGDHINYLYAARFLGGISGGGIFVVIPLYVSDIANKKVRGSLGSYILNGTNIGYVLGFMAGDKLAYYTVPKVFIILPLIFVVAIHFMPETPRFLMQQNRLERAKKSLIFYNGLGTEDKYNEEKYNIILGELKSVNPETEGENTHLKFSDFWESRKFLFISFGLAGITILSGYAALITYTASIVQSSGSSTDPNSSATIISIVNLFGGYTNTLISDRVKRKTLMISTLIATSFGYLATGLYSIFINHFEGFSWIPTVTLSWVIFIASMGFLPLSILVIPELLPAKIRSIAFGICNCLLNILAFGSLKIYPVLIADISLPFVMWLCAGFCALAAVFVLYCVPETRGKAI